MELLVIILVVVDFVNGGEILEKLSGYTVIYPRQYSGDKSNKQINTIIDEELGAHLHKVSFEFEKSADEHLVLDLDINKDLISSKFTQSLYGNDGLQDMVITEKDLHHCNYHGKVRGIEDSDVTLSTCNGLRGFIDYNDNFYYIEPISDNHVTDGHVLYKPTDHQYYNHPHGGASTCGVESSATNRTSATSDDFMELRRRRRSASANQKYFIETLIVMDKENYDRFKTPEERQNHVKEVINLVDGYYKPLNFRVVLSHIEFWKKENRAVMDTNANTALNVFMEYRSKQLADDKDEWKDTDVSHLLYGRNFDGTTIGMAHVSAMCGYKSGSVNQDLGSPLRVAPTVAHEMGHNFGMHHDTSSCSCKDGTDCIMAPQAGFRQQKSWSQCSVEYLQQGLSIGLGSCLMNVPNAGTLYGGPVCGNEIIERGEECDCGSPVDCTSKCCNATTCLLQPQAQCDSGECCQDCKFQPSGTMCRSTDGNECDLPEFCSGATPFCPGNVFREDGSSCKETEICHEGICLTHDLQCKLIWGKDAWNGDDLCYTHVNKQGNANGNCGKNNDGSFRRCQAADVKCGKLNCHGDSRYPVLKGLDTKYNYLNSVRDVDDKCKTIASDTKNITESQDFDDTGMVQEGTGCGTNKVCRDNKCTHIEVLDCTTKCNNRGVCNNKGNCHCDPEWSPPYCLKKGRGGSIDSGPVSVKGIDRDTILMIVLFVVVLPFLLLTGTFIWYRACGGKRQIKKMKENREVRLEALAAAPEEKQRLAAVAAMKGKTGKRTSLTSSTSSLVLTEDQHIDLMKTHPLRSMGNEQISGPLPIYSNLQPQVAIATPKGSPRPSKPPPPRPTVGRPSPAPVRPSHHAPVKPSPKPTRIPPKIAPPVIPAPPVTPAPPVIPAPPPSYKKPSQRPQPPSSTDKPIFTNQLRSGGSMTPPPPPPSSKKPSPFGGGRKAYSKPNTPAKMSTFSQPPPTNGIHKQSGDEDDDRSFSVQALKARFNAV